MLEYRLPFVCIDERDDASGSLWHAPVVDAGLRESPDDSFYVARLYRWCPQKVSIERMYGQLFLTPVDRMWAEPSK